MRTLILLLTALLALAACEKKEEEQKPEATAEADPAAGDRPAEEGTAEGAAAKPESAEAPAEGEWCVQAFTDMEKLIKGLEEQLGKEESGSELPPRQTFVSACRELPEQMQKCMTFKYAMQNQDECEKAQEELDPEVAERVKSLMGQTKPAEEPAAEAGAEE